MSLTRRRVLRGMIGGAAVTVGLPLFDCLFDRRGEALAQTGQAPARFGTWFWGCGMNPDRWVPEREGRGYDLPPELAMAAGDRAAKISVLSGFDTPLNGRNNYPHYSPPVVTMTGDSPAGDDRIPRSTFDAEIARVIGNGARFGVLDLTADGWGHAWSAQTANTPSPAESSPVALYQRVFGSGFQVGGAGEFMPDPEVLLRKSVLSVVLEQAQALERELGSHDKQRLDQYFTAVRQLENQLTVLTSEPPELPACVAPDAPGDNRRTLRVAQVVGNHRLLVDLLVMALACDQTRVFNLSLWRLFTDVRFPGDDVGYHQLTHDEPVDPDLGYQPHSQDFLVEAMKAWSYFIEQLDSVDEGDGTLLDNCAVLAHSCTEFPKDHGTQNLPFLLAGSGGGRFLPGQHVRGGASSVARIALTMQQAFGVPVGEWGAGDNQTRSPIATLLA